MTFRPDDAPLACSLSDEQLRKRKETLLAQLSFALIVIEELPDGYAFQIPSDGKSIVSAAELIAAERDCCPFLTFEIIARQNRGPVTLRMTGPPGAKEFAAELLRVSASHPKIRKEKDAAVP